MDLEKVVRDIVKATLKELEKEKVYFEVPVGVSGRHVHLSQEDLEVLFGKGYSLTVFKNLKQPGQFAANEKVTLTGPLGAISNVRILGPVRSKTQIEISLTDCFTLGLKAPLRDSGDLTNSGKIVIIGPKGEVIKKEGLIIARNHLHLSIEDGRRYGLKDKDRVNIYTSGERQVAFFNVLVRCGNAHATEFHVDTDEANAAFLKTGDLVKVEKI